MSLLICTISKDIEQDKEAAKEMSDLLKKHGHKLWYAVAGDVMAYPKRATYYRWTKLL